MEAETLSIVDQIGQQVVIYVIQIADLVAKSKSSPGIIALILLSALVIASILFFIKSQERRKSIREMDALVSQYDGIPAFANNFSDFRSQISQKKDSSRSWKILWEAWDEFSETIVPDDVDGPLRLRNSIRPSSFMNVEDLDFGPGVFRILPNIFVSVGLFFTFLGLVAALNQFVQSINPETEGVAMNIAMTTFMQIASAKFIMSLVGLLCSILFTVLMRSSSATLDRELHRLCLKIERRLVFVSLEDLGFRQLRAATEQREYLREIGMGMVAELQRPLEALPDQITTSIAERMDPIFEKVSSMGASGVEGLVGDLSTQLSHSVGNALTRASESLGEATDRIGSMVDQLNASNSQAGEGLQNAVNDMAKAISDMQREVATSGQTASSTMSEGADRLLTAMNETLAGIRDNTSKGADAIQAAAQEMRKAAESFREEISAATADGASAVRSHMEASSAQAGAAIESAGKSLMTSFEETSQEIARIGSEMGNVVGEELLERLETVGSRLSDMAEAIQKGADGAKSAASGLQSGAEAIAGASDNFGNASRQLVSASEPLRDVHQRIETEIRQLGNAVSTVAETLTFASTTIAENASHVLETASTALGTEREGIRGSLEATRAALVQLSAEAEKLDEIDAMLGKALKEYNSQLEAALGSAQDHVSQMRDTLAPGIDTLRSVVEQAESFMPAQNRRT